ncbi:MAG: dockerin type I repeat-containing protein [bacterium]|nr:dockerin type I repeat-containing protein [bacterium]
MLRHLLVISLLVLFTGQMSLGKDAPVATKTEVSQAQPSVIRVTPKLIAADTCIARSDTGAVWSYGNWLYGDELYENFIDPDVSCPSAYPYVITEVILELLYLQAHVDTFEVNILDVDWSDPSCPKPGTTLAISPVWEVPIPDPGLWSIPLELGTPVTVNGPFFAGFYMADILDSATRANYGPHLVTDGDTLNPRPPCVSYNLFDTTGWIDLSNEGFAGYLTLYVSGIPGGGGDPNPPPLAEILTPTTGLLYEPIDIWVRDKNFSDSIETVTMEYAQTPVTTFTEITTLTSSALSFRDGIGPADSGPGYAFEWDPTALGSGSYWLRVTMTDTQGRISMDTVQSLAVVPSPPTVAITSPAEGTNFCASLSLMMSSPSPTLTTIDLYAKEGSLNYSLGMAGLNQSALGDNNQNPNDGNYAFNGEFGDYYSGPVAAAQALKVWADRGETALMMDGVTQLTTAQVAELLAVKFKTRDYLGTTDEDIFAGIRDYAAEKSVSLNLFAERNPDYFDIRNRVEGDEHVAVIGIGGTPAAWLAVDGFEQWEQPGPEYFIRVADPLNGTIRNLPIRNVAGGCEVQFYSAWQKVDIMISCVSNAWPVTRTYIGQDNNGADQWQFLWTPLADNLNEGSPYFITAEGTSPAVYGHASALYRYSCASVTSAGDYNGDNNADINDFFLLQNYIALGVVPPIGGAFRADANGDNSINLADLVFYMRYLFGGNPPPVY